MRNLIQKLLNWVLGYDISASIRALEETSTQQTDEVISIVDTAVTDIMEQWSNELETLNNYDWDDFSQRLDNVQHLTDFSPDDLREELSQRLCMDGKEQATDSKDFKELQKLVWDRGERILALETGLNHLDEADEANDTTGLQSQIDDFNHDLKALEMNQESTDQWFQSFLNANHEHYMQQAGGKD
tara:strand:+ start:2075 stop:2632 length:558 start_codon:yes stop_codon:yes gene_type:complete